MPLKNDIRDRPTDTELISEYRRTEDPKVLGDLYRGYMDLVYGVCLKYLKQTDDAKDAVINIFEELIEKLKKHEIAYFRGWLFQVAKNHCLMKLRSGKKQPVNVDIDIMHLGEIAHPEEGIYKEKQLTELEACIDKLPDLQKVAVTLFYLKEKCYKEIAEQTGLELNKVRSFIQNGRRNLKICIEKSALLEA